MVVTDGFILMEVKAEYYGFTEEDMGFLGDKTIFAAQGHVRSIFNHLNPLDRFR